MDTVLELAKGNKSFVSFFDDNNHQIKSAPPLCQAYDHPDKLKAVTEHKSRLNKIVV